MRELFLIFLRLGLTSFGGPVAHLGYFRTELVERRRWMTDAAYADLVALCQFLPGPASSQVVIGIGFLRRGYLGAVLASLGFTLPSMLLMIAFGYGLVALSDAPGLMDGVHALKLVAVAVVAQAIWSMARQLCPDRLRASLALAAAACLLIWPGTLAQLAVILSAGVIGWRLCTPMLPDTADPLPTPMTRGPAITLLATFLVVLSLTLLPSGIWPSHGLEMAVAMFRSGALVFGGGHVVLPLLEAETVRTGWVSQEAFLAGYGAAQALPGPLFTFAAFLGTVETPQPNGVLGGALATLAIFLPSLLLVLGLLPFWVLLRANRAIRAALAGVNAAVVGLLLAAFYDPVITTAITDGADAAFALGAFALLVLWRIPAWILVVSAGLGASVIGLLL
jgi:chromate transporter